MIRIKISVSDFCIYYFFSIVRGRKWYLPWIGSKSKMGGKRNTSLKIVAIKPVMEYLLLPTWAKHTQLMFSKVFQSGSFYKPPLSLLLQHSCVTLCSFTLSLSFAFISAFKLCSWFQLVWGSLSQLSLGDGGVTNGEKLPRFSTSGYVTKWTCGPAGDCATGSGCCCVGGTKISVLTLQLHWTYCTMTIMLL